MVDLRLPWLSFCWKPVQQPGFTRSLKKGCFLFFCASVPLHLLPPCSSVPTATLLLSRCAYHFLCSYNFSVSTTPPFLCAYMYVPFLCSLKPTAFIYLLLTSFSAPTLPLFACVPLFLFSSALFFCAYSSSVPTVPLYLFFSKPSPVYLHLLFLSSSVPLFASVPLFLSSSSSVFLCSSVPTLLLFLSASVPPQLMF